MKFIITKPLSTDAGTYLGLSESFQYGAPVEAEYINSKKKGIHIKGSEFIRLGADASMFTPDVDYIWGSFTLVEEE